jgi:hypothetical protein
MFATTVKAGMGALLLATVPVGGDPAAWGQWGLAGLVVGFTLYRDHHRERRMAAELDRQQAWVRETLLRALERNTGALDALRAWLGNR